jgi:hypothetical protein
MQYVIKTPNPNVSPPELPELTVRWTNLIHAREAKRAVHRS